MSSRPTTASSGETVHGAHSTNSRAWDMYDFGQSEAEAGGMGKRKGKTSQGATSS
jgi:hypothetical protein